MHSLEVALAREGDEGRVVEIGVGHGGDQVRRTRAQRAEAHAGAAGQPAEHVGHVRPALLVANRHELDGRVREGLVEVQGLLARNAEDVGHALGLQAVDEHLRGLAVSHEANVSPAFRRALAPATGDQG